MNVNKIINQKCAPSKKFTDNSCLTHESLKKIAREYNKKNKLNLYIDEDLPKKELVHELEKKLSDVCSNHVCWLRHKILQNLNDPDIIENTFRPKGPSRKYEWLSNFDIENVVNQYTSLYNDFIFLGALPYDFEDINIFGISKLNFEELEQQNKHKIGMVINLDEHYKGGSHWVSLYVDLEKYQIYFFDSVGKKPYKRIRKFINKILKYLYYKKYNQQLYVKDILHSINRYKENKNIEYVYDNEYIYNILKNFDIKYNNIQHQFKNSECGVYSINFITRLLDGETFENIINNPTSDDKMNEFRKLYFYNVN
jgi:hypothetical protein